MGSLNDDLNAIHSTASAYQEKVDSEVESIRMILAGADLSKAAGTLHVLDFAEAGNAPTPYTLADALGHFTHTPLANVIAYSNESMHMIAQKRGNIFQNGIDNMSVYLEVAFSAIREGLRKLNPEVAEACEPHLQ